MMKFAKIIWFFNRLRAMGPVEVLWRFRNEARSHLEFLNFMTADSVPEAELRGHNSAWLPVDDLRSIQYDMTSDADILLKEGMDLFSLGKKVPCITPLWNRDPRTGTVCPLTFGKKLNFKDQTVCGDVKYLWELSRFLQIVPLARAWATSKDEKYLEAIHLMVESWLEECPYLKGIHWSSSLELGIRLINWSIAWQYIGGISSPLFTGTAGEKFRDRWLKSIYQHIHFIDSWYSKGSSANNHLIGEASGVFTACRTWPFWKECRKWEGKSLNILETEIQKQMFEDGVDREQTISYQQFVADFLLLPYLADKKSFSQEYVNKFERMVGFIGSMMDVSGNVPMIGDSDNGIVTGLGMHDGFNPYRSLLASGGYLFERDDFLLRSGGHDLKSLCLIGAVSSDIPKLDSLEIPPFERVYQSGGYFVLGDNFDTGEELYLVADAGPLGYGTLAAHGHADALSVYLTFKGLEFLIDPGTYVYNGNPKWRNYFRGTSAHNTIRIDGVDQSEIGGDFLWKSHAETEGSVHFDHDVESFRGTHNGYARLSDPVIHERVISLDKVNSRIVIQDHLRCKETHVAEQFWHFSENCEVVFDGPNRVVVTNSGVSLRLHFGEAVSLQIVKGDLEKPLGWVSRRFGEKVPSTTVVAEVNIEADAFLITEIIY